MVKTKLPDFKYEKALWRNGFNYIAGVDEVGKGCFAGPIVAGSVVFPQISNNKLQIPNNIKINDSKRLSPKQREISAEWIKKNAIACGIGSASAAQINRLGIKKASEIAFRKAIKSCGNVDFLLIDAFYIPYVKGLRRKNQKAIIKGDTKSVSIAAASIVAKVYRDKLMKVLSQKSKFKRYHWDRNKGYGTREHQTAIKKYGTTGQHRKKWVETWLSKSKVKI